MKQLIVLRVGFTHVDGEGYDGPEAVLQGVLRTMEQEGHDVVSVSVQQSSRGDERYEAFIVSRWEEP